MNSLEQLLQYPLGEAMPAPGESLVVAEDAGGGLTPTVKWIRMALPFALDHINLWLLRDEIDGHPGWTVVDCCISRDESKVQWERVFASQLDGLPILRVIVTHMHPDHIGLAHWLCERWDARLWISATDFSAARMASQGTTAFGGESAAAFFASHGLTDPACLAKIRGRADYYPSLVPDVPRSYRRLQDGDKLVIGGREWQCISGYGHAPEHIALHCPRAGLLISGDMLLPRISTNVSVYDIEPESDPLRLFLASIDRFARLPADTLTLPSHGKPFLGLHERIRQLHEHHAERLAEVEKACAAAPSCAADLLPVLFKRELDLHQTTFAMGESVAHLHALWYLGKLRRQRDDDGVFRFVPA
jgi:glyoxylase-like metal-dependent hydrolase (beta-lactamase superfamily II)